MEGSSKEIATELWSGYRLLARHPTETTFLHPLEHLRTGTIQRWQDVLPVLKGSTHAKLNDKKPGCCFKGGLYNVLQKHRRAGTQLDLRGSLGWGVGNVQPEGLGSPPVWGGVAV